MPYIILRGRWLHIIVLNVHAPTEDKTDDVKISSMSILTVVLYGRETWSLTVRQEYKLRVFEGRLLR
jgi:hypothetical protein